MTRIFAVLLVLAACTAAIPRISQAQVAPAGYRKPLSLSAGGMVSIFDPSYVQNKIGGIGAYVDLNLFLSVGLEAEGRWQRFHGYQGIQQDNYLIGPRVHLPGFWRARPYVKVLGGFSHMNFENNVATGKFTTIALGGGIDIPLRRHWSVRVADVEYQEWPRFLNDSLSPLGVSGGISYRIF